MFRKVREEQVPIRSKNRGFSISEIPCGHKSSIHEPNGIEMKHMQSKLNEKIYETSESEGSAPAEGGGRKDEISKSLYRPK